MERSAVLKRIEVIVQDVLDDDKISLTEQTSADEIEDWDSLANIQIVVGMQKEFGKKIPAQVIVTWKSVGDMIDYIINE